MKKNLSILLSLIIISFSFFSPFLAFADELKNVSIKLDFIKETQVNNLLDWNIAITTTNVPGGTTVYVHRLLNNDSTKDTVTTLQILSGTAVYDTGAVLTPSTNYTIKVLVNGSSVIQTLTRTTGQTTTQLINASVVGGTFSYFDSTTNKIITDKNGVSLFDTIVSCNTSHNQYLLDNPSASVTACTSSNTSLANSAQVVTPITGQKNTTTNNSVYTLLAPIGSFTQMTSATDIGTYFNIIIKIAIGLCAVLAVIFIIIGGIQYMGDESIFGKTEAKSQITAAILGLLIALGAYVILNTINPDLLGKNGVNIQSVSAAIDDETETTPWEGYSNTGDTTACPEGFIDVLIGGDKNNKINVCNSVADELTYMINAAQRAGVILSGSGTRSTADQQALRVAHGCADPALPSTSCNPQTARPGHSMHQAGKAIDFKCSGKQLTKSDVCYQWLTTNAKTYGFYNLPSEPWHWSTTGK